MARILGYRNRSPQNAAVLARPRPGRSVGASVSAGRAVSAKRDRDCGRSAGRESSRSRALSRAPRRNLRRSRRLCGSGAARTAWRSLDISDRALADILTIGSERNKSAVLANLEDPIPRLIALQTKARTPEARALAFEAVALACKAACSTPFTIGARACVPSALDAERAPGA